MTNDPRPLFARAAEQAAELIGSVRAEHLDGPTPCSEFDVRTLLSHLTGGTHRMAVVAEGGDAAAVRPFAEGVPDDGWTAAYDEGRTRAVKAWAADDLLDTVVRLPFGEMPGRAALSAYVLETVTHTWDLSEALGHPRARPGARRVRADRRPARAAGRTAGREHAVRHGPAGPRGRRRPRQAGGLARARAAQPSLTRAS
ncbi:TIGR03086 family metal-binding protein [Streptomyces sp. NPDC007991]|uniref:TIGR03086 family metal-binding protein n=1 Tax=Streptomyces sp. NPDC007991 TaxID=3364803 RepID=UPI0036EDD460